MPETVPQFENRQNVQLTCHTRDEGEGEENEEQDEQTIEEGDVATLSTTLRGDRCANSWSDSGRQLARRLAGAREIQTYVQT